MIRTVAFNPFKPSVLYVGHWQTLQNQIRHHTTRYLIMFSTVCLHRFLLKMNKNEKYHQTTLNGLIKLIEVGI